MQNFILNVDQDIHKKLINIDQYMKDLKKHANHEYDELFEKEQEEMLFKRKSRKKKKKGKNKTLQQSNDP